ncbi:MAG TPA: hypothetical protein VFQ85_16310 [Mycobacteriales bacterium]|nr:hypothetical protein [Mycobacteriales bacterium]
MNRIVPLMAVLLLTGSCAAAGDAVRAEKGAVRPPARPAIDWDHPLAAAIRTDRAHARTAGHLRFVPVVPQFAAAERAVEVTDPAVDDGQHGSVAFVYDLPPSDAFPAGGRVVVVEGPTDTTEADIPRIVASNGAEHFHEVTVGGRQALLIEADGIGRVRIFRNGIVIDVTGPAVSPEAVVALADAIG